MQTLLLALVFALLCSGPPPAARADRAPRPHIHAVQRGDTLSEIARRYRVSQEQLRRWNELRSDRIAVGQKLELWIGEAADPESYLVRKGDTLTGIAQRFGLPLTRLRQLNNLRDDTIRLGQHLRLRPTPAHQIPVHAVQPGDSLSEIAQTYGLSLEQLKTLNDLQEETIHPGQQLRVAERQSEEEPREYEVRKGDTLSGIAQRFDVGLALLRQLNDLRGDTIRPGQKLRLRPNELEEGVHIVRPGETLSGIALHYRLKLDTLREINGLEGDRILVGQKLRLRSTPRAVHIVERGDALWELARAYAMSVAELKELNGLSSDRIYPGQELKLHADRAEHFDFYTVEKGDYLGEIARLHQMSVAELKKVNQLRSSVIHPGDRLKVRPLLGQSQEGSHVSTIDWDALKITLGDVGKYPAENGPYYFSRPRAGNQKGKTYYEGHPHSPLRTYGQARRLWESFESEVERLGRLSDELEGWHIVLDPGHGGLDPGAVVSTLDGNGQTLYVVEDEYVYDIALRAYVLLRLHGAGVTLTLLSPNHLIRQNSPPTQTFVNEKNEVYNSRAHNQSDQRHDWPRGGNLRTRVDIARQAFAQAPAHRRIFLSFHADIDPHSPEAPLVLYYEGRTRRKDLASQELARHLLPALGAGARMRGQGLGVLRDNPASAKVLIELRNLAYQSHVWALRFEQLRHRDAEKVVRGVLDYARSRTLSARR